MGGKRGMFEEFGSISIFQFIYCIHVYIHRENIYTICISKKKRLNDEKYTIGFV